MEDKQFKQLLEKLEENKNVTVVNRGGLGLCSIIFIVFLILKLTKAGLVVSWPWVCVFIPLMVYPGIPIAVALICLVVVGLCALAIGIINLFEKIFGKR